MITFSPAPCGPAPPAGAWCGADRRPAAPPTAALLRTEYSTPPGAGKCRPSGTVRPAPPE